MVGDPIQAARAGINGGPVDQLAAAAIEKLDSEISADCARVQHPDYFELPQRTLALNNVRPAPFVTKFPLRL